MTRRTRIDDAFDVICEYARDNNGCTPSSYTLGELMEISHQYAGQLLNRLDNQRRIKWVTRNTYMVVPAVWSLREVNSSE